ncbi:MAG: metal-dependent hydrolase, partial [Thermicanus sp.]|nr:metal-dependent hydrolase [Thermicanus sp.]
GSQIPDLDTVLRLKGNATFIRHHRGISHSIPALLLYTVLLTWGLSFIGEVSLLHLLFWSFLAIHVHVFTDLLNSYGVQAFRPFTSRWVSWNVLPIFDPVIFGLHVIGIGLWAIGLHPGFTFLAIYLAFLPYGGWRYYLKKRLETKLRMKLGVKGEITLLPTSSPFRWEFLIYGESRIQFGEWKGKEFVLSHSIPYPNTRHPIVQASESHKEIRNFLYFSRYPYSVWREREFGYEVRWIDLRYLSKKNYPLLAIIYLDKNLMKIDAYVGWKQEEKISEKLGMSLAYFD